MYKRYFSVNKFNNLSNTFTRYYNAQKNAENSTNKGILKARKILVYIEVHEFSESAQYITEKHGELGQ